MTLGYHDIVGTVGVIVIVVAYFLLQIEKLQGTSLTFSVSNAVGSALILFSLLFEFNAPAFLIEVFWLLISLIGVIRFFSRRNAASA